MNPNVFLFNNKLIDYDYDVIVIGGGHAGVEAAYAASNLGSKTLLLTLNIDRIALMPCNPAIGGIGKGHIVFELSAFNGLMPKVVTKTYLQARMLNTKKGPAVQGLRVQIDKTAYSKEVIKELRQTKNLTIVMAMVEEFLVSDNKIYGIKTREGEVYYSKSVILTSGTFLQGLIHVGHTNYNGGRQGDEACNSLSLQLLKLGFNLKRLKTGTPARILGSSINFSLMVEQPSDDLNYLFEFSPHKVVGKLSCYITSTNENTHNIIKNNFDKSPIFTGYIKGTPPRYCPSIEDKISRFSLKNSHNVFVEPENETAQEYYPNGLSTSLPFDVQKKFIKSIKGFEDAILTRPGYAIEYDAIFARFKAYFRI
jgi:tRNA uridine 5-carboxymethylaminomethyl modification enzyme